MKFKATCIGNEYCGFESEVEASDLRTAQRIAETYHFDDRDGLFSIDCVLQLQPLEESSG